MPAIYQDTYDQIGIEPVLNLYMTVGQGALSGLLMLGIAVAASWLPARVAAGLEPVDAMRAA